MNIPCFWHSVIDLSLHFPFRHCYRWQLDSPFWFIVTFQLWCNFWRPSTDLNIITHFMWISEKILSDSILSKWLKNDLLLLKISSYYRRQSIKRLDIFFLMTTFFSPKKVNRRKNRTRSTNFAPKYVCSLKIISKLQYYTFLEIVFCTF